ncbi:hypothetical protein ACIGXM_02625 [Kitasatospora sp. NPDC052896]|uniref:hypothetical protein n=1 Tax=Kitasatospora sp. NPDC052896 TaxID=3364061 RepID=UPI0037C79B69
MPRQLFVLLLLLLLLPGFVLARSAFGRWRDQRAAVTYELVADPRPTLMRAAGAALCLVCAVVLVVGSVLSWRTSAGGAQSADAVGPASGARAAAEVRPAPVPGAAPGAAAAPAPAAGSPAPPPVVVPWEIVGHPAGGELRQAEVPGADGQPRTVRVWLPPHYADDRDARYPVLVLQAAGSGKTADAELPDVFDGIASAVKLGRSRPFVVVAPAGPTGAARPCDLVVAAPQALADDARMRASVAASFHTMSPGPQGWAALGVEGGAPCAAAAGLTRGDLYGAAAAVSGRYDVPALVQAGTEAPAGRAPQLMLAAAKGDADGLASARALLGALRGGKGQAARAVVRISDNVQDFTADKERLRLVRVATQYLAETLTQPNG